MSAPNKPFVGQDICSVAFPGEFQQWARYRINFLYRVVSFGEWTDHTYTETIWLNGDAEAVNYINRVGLFFRFAHHGRYIRNPNTPAAVSSELTQLWQNNPEGDYLTPTVRNLNVTQHNYQFNLILQGVGHPRDKITIEYVVQASDWQNLAGLIVEFLFCFNNQFHFAVQTLP
jgi:hypothetical protein